LFVCFWVFCLFVCLFWVGPFPIWNPDLESTTVSRGRTARPGTTFATDRLVHKRKPNYELSSCSKVLIHYCLSLNQLILALITVGKLKVKTTLQDLCQSNTLVIHKRGHLPFNILEVGWKKKISTHKVSKSRRNWHGYLQFLVWTVVELLCSWALTSLCV